MQRLFWTFGTAAILLLTAWPDMAIAQDAREANLAIEVSLQGPAKVDRPTKVMVVLTNTGTTPIALPLRPDWDEVGGLEIGVETQGRQARKLDPPDAGPRQVIAPEQSKFLLAPGGSFAVFRLFAPGELF